MMTCRELTELVTDYLEDTLPIQEKLTFQKHIGMCKSCRSYVRQMQQTVEVLGQLPPELDIPDEVRADFLAHFRSWKSEEAAASEAVDADGPREPEG